MEYCKLCSSRLSFWDIEYNEILCKDCREDKSNYCECGNQLTDVFYDIDNENLCKECARK